MIDPILEPFARDPAKDLVYLSATQIDTYVDCNRKWAWDKIAKVPRQPNKYAQFGLALHDVGEAWLKTAAPPPDTDAGVCFRAGMKHLPNPGACRTVEDTFEWDVGEGMIVVGKKDFTFDEQGAASIGDHKTTGNFDWAKSREELQEDVQAVLYAAHEQAVTQATFVRGRWVYYLRNPKRPRSRRVDFVLHREELADKWGAIMEVCREMVDVKRAAPDPLDLPYNVTACDKYGGCPYWDSCKLSDRERMRAIMAQQSLKDKLEARKNQTPPVNPPEQAQIPPPQVVPTQAVPPTAAQAGGGTDIKRLMAERLAQVQPAQPPSHVPPPPPAPVQIQDARGMMPGGEAQIPQPAPVQQPIPAPVATQPAPVPQPTTLVKIEHEALAGACDAIAQGFADIAALIRTGVF